MADESNNNSKEIRQLQALFHQEYIIMAEFRMLQTENIQGVYVIPSYESSFLWYGVIFVNSGYYEGGVFRFTISLPDKFPNEDVPIVTFCPSLYHPAIDSNTGVLYLNEVFPQWDRQHHHIWHLLKYVHYVFNNLNVKVPVNIEASVAFKSNKKLFIEKVKESVISSIDHLYDDPPTDDKHYISFKPYDPEIHDPIVQGVMLKEKDVPEEVSQGISWVQPESFQPFSKDEAA